MAVDPRTPCLVGVAQYVDRDSAPDHALSPLAMLEQVARAAAADTGAGDALIAGLDTIAVVRTFPDSAPIYRSPFGQYTNLPKSLANRLGAAPAHCIYPVVGGNTPQWLVNVMAQRILNGAADGVLLAGVEALRTQAKAVKAGVPLDWSDDPGVPPEPLGTDKFPITKAEIAHQVTMPVNVYPLFENALGAHYGRTPLDHRAAIGALMARFTEVAAANPYAALPVARTPAEIIEPTADNRYIAYPYTKYLNSNMFVDQAAAVVMLSTAKADALGIPQSARVYLQGCADTAEKWFVSDRMDFHSSPAIRIGAAHALAQAGVTVDQLHHIDLYSCFPVAVQVAADMIGLAHDDPRGLTLTGGLPYFGGPGNNYSMHAIAEVVARCRAAPGSHGFVFANGYYLTKHSFGVYGTTPPPPGWHRTDPASYQATIDAMPSPPFIDKPEGRGRVETFTVLHDKGQPSLGIVFGRLDDGDGRFLAVTFDPAMLARMIDQPVVGQPIVVTPGDPCNQVAFA